jgi:hypothetical protein
MWFLTYLVCEVSEVADMKPPRVFVSPEWIRKEADRMNKMRNIILATAVALLSSLAFAQEPTNKPQDDLFGHITQQEYLEEMRTEEGSEKKFLNEILAAAVSAGMLSVVGVMFYLRHKEKKKSDSVNR